MDSLLSLLGREGYPLHGDCLVRTPGLWWSMIIADLAMAAACLSIGVVLIRFVRQRDTPGAQTLPRLFGVFVLACGLGHVTQLWTLWAADCGPQALTDGLTAVISIVIAVALWRMMPQWLHAPTIAQWRAGVASLDAEVHRRQGLEDSLAEVQQSLAVTLDSIGAGFLATDAQGRVTRMNAIAERMLGWTQAEAAGEGLWRVFVREGRSEEDLAMNPVDVMLRDRIGVDTGSRLVACSRTGVRTPVELKAALTRAPDGSPRGIAIVLRDLTDQLAAESAASRLAAIVESSEDAIVGKTLEGRITSWNPGAARLFGYTAAEAIGQSMQMLIPPDRSSEETTILARIAAGESVKHFETVRRRKDGSLVDISTTISPVRDASGQVVGASKIARDFTERRRSDMRLLAQLQRLRLLDQITRAIGERLDLASVFQVAVRSLADELPADLSCVMTHDIATHTMLVTSVAYGAAQAGLLPADVVPVDGNGLSRCLRGELVYEPNTAALAFPFPQRLATAGLLSVVVAPLQSQDQIFGVLLAARASADAFSSAECEFIRQLSSHVALAARQARLHGELQGAFDELSRTQQFALQQERLRALGQMASGIAHDINNALSPAVLYAENILAHESLSERARGQMKSIAQAVDDVASTVARLREFYRSADTPRQLQPVALNGLLQRVVELSRARWSDMPQERGIVIDVATQLSTNLPPVWGMESEIRDALINLVFNAIDAMPDGGSLTLRTRVLPEPAASGPGWVAVDVIDTGTGMDETTRLHCLEPFFTTKGERGTGLGLAMVYGAAKRHGAEIDIDSAPGRGTAVTLRFKAGPQGPRDTAVPSPERPTASLDILVIDDDPALLRSLRDSLQADGHSVRMADGGQAGIDAFARALTGGRPFDVVFTDLGMPHVDGRSVAAAVKRLSASTPVVLLTGWGQRMVEDGETPANVDLVLSKPPRLSQLRAGLQTCRARGSAS